MTKTGRRHWPAIRKARMARPHKVWQLQEAKTHFSELIKEVEEDGCHMITKNGHPVAMIISTGEFEKLHAIKNTLLDFFREAPLPNIDIDIERDKDPGREVDS